MEEWFIDWSDTEESDLDNPDDDYMPKLPSIRESKRRKRIDVNEEVETVSRDGGDGNGVCGPGSTTPTRPRVKKMRANSTLRKKGKGCSKSKISKKSKQGDVCTDTEKEATAVTGGSIKRKMLRKNERAEIMESVKKIPLHIIMQRVQGKVNEQLMSEYLLLKEIFQALVQNEQLFMTLIEHHRTTFAYLYTQYSKGKEKYLNFQLGWHTHCSALLLPKQIKTICVFTLPPDGIEEIDRVRKLWLDFCDAYSSAEQENCNKIMILLSSALYDVLLQQMHTHNAKLSASTTCTLSSCDGDDVYIRFGGATLSSMLHLRYKDIRRCPEERRDTISQEIQILQAINTKEKESMPQYLKYRDQGYMYTPDTVFVPFFQAVDNCIKEVVNQRGFHEHGDEMIKMAHTLVSQRTSLKDQFMTLLSKHTPITTDSEEPTQRQAISNVFDEMVRKLANTRIQEFLSSQKQKIASSKGHASTISQNLRDSLLTQHTNLQSRTKI